MEQASRRVYVTLGRAFVAVGAIIALAGLVDRAAGWGYFRASPVGTALFLAAIGVLLLWTVRQADRRDASGGQPGDEPGDEPGVEPGDDEARL